MTEPTPDQLTVVQRVRTLLAASSTASSHEVAAMYAAMARTLFDYAFEELRPLKLAIEAREAELVRRAPAQRPRLEAPEQP